MKPYKFGKDRPRRMRKLGLFFIIACLIAAAAGFMGLRYLYEQNLEAVDPAATTDIVYTLEQGTSLPEIGSQLEDRQLIRSRRAFTQYVRGNGQAAELKAGTYRLRQSMDVPEIVSVLTDGRVAHDLLTILPGRRLDQIKTRLMDYGFTEVEIDAAFEPGQYAGHPALEGKPAGASLEGYLYPDSYHFVEGQTSVAQIVRLALDEMAKALTPDLRARFTAAGLSVYEGLTLASIVEKEAGSREDKPAVAQVFLNRLARGMRLESDPTAVYGAVMDGAALPEQYAINAAIAYDSSYNTYKIDGLMPGPISNVNADSLNAVVNPAGGDYLFFVAGADCTTRFSRSIAEHEALISRHGLSTQSDLCH